MTSYSFPGYFHSGIMSVLVNVLSLQLFERVLPIAAYVGGDTKSSLCPALVKLSCLFSLSSLYLYQKLMASVCNASIIASSQVCQIQISFHRAAQQKMFHTEEDSCTGKRLQFIRLWILNFSVSLKRCQEVLQNYWSFMVFFQNKHTEMVLLWRNDTGR